jgi:hypothetical protein
MGHRLGVLTSGDKEDRIVVATAAPDITPNG